MDERERQERWLKLRRENEDRGRAIQKEFEACLRKEVAPSLKALGFTKPDRAFHWERDAQPGRIDTIDVVQSRSNLHPEALLYDATFGVRIVAVETAKGKPEPNRGRRTEGTPFPLPGRSADRASTVRYEVNAEVPFSDVCTQIVADATAASAALEALDVASLDSVLAWYAGDPRQQAFAHAAFGDLDQARATYPRSRARAYDTDRWPDSLAERLGLDPAPLPPEGGHIDEAPVAAAVREAFGAHPLGARAGRRVRDHPRWAAHR